MELIKSNETGQISALKILQKVTFDRNNFHRWRRDFFSIVSFIHSVAIIRLCN